MAATDEKPAVASRATLATFLTIVAVAAVLRFGKDVFLPLAIAMLITFALSPLVSILRNRGMPLLVSVLGVVTLAFAVIGLFLLVVFGQVGQLAQQLPTFQANIVTKLEGLQGDGSTTGVAARLGRLASAINDQISSAVATDTGTETSDDAPMPVEIVEPQSALVTLVNLVLPLVAPVATAGLVIVVVVFMLLERDELRDRFIRLVGSNDIHRTTQMLEEAGGRVGTYLLVQLLVNTIYAVPIGLGLWLIGVPNAALWGMLTLVLRFVPYIGSVLAAAFPLFLAFAVSPDWSVVLWTAALFLVVELVTSNVIEPWLYGSRTGVSPLAIIVAAIFWTWVWGPLGLVMSTPLTVCLVVLGRHIPQFEVFDILFGDNPVLAPPSRLYQRLLVGDVVESAFRAEEALEDTSLADYHATVGIPALLLAQSDYERGVVSAEQEQSLADAAMRLLDELEAVVTEELNDGAETLALAESRPDGAGKKVVFVGGRSSLDDVSARMLAQAAAADGAEATALSHADLAPSRFGRVRDTTAGCVVLAFLDVDPARASLLHIRRIKRAAPHLRVGVVLWHLPEDADLPLAASARASRSKLAEIDDLGADFCATSLDAALAEAYSADAPRPPGESAPAAPRRRRAPASKSST